MKRIVLCCAGGMSSSLLVQRMEKTAAARGVANPILAIGVGRAERGPVEDAACILIGPQVGYTRPLVEEANPGVPVELIPMYDYGHMDADRVLDQALRLMGAGPQRDDGAPGSAEVSPR